MIRLPRTALAGLLTLVACWPSLAAAMSPPVEAFAQPDAFHEIALSSDGSRIAVAVQRDNVDVLEVFHVDRLADGPTATYRLGPRSWIDWLAWKGDRLVMGVGIPDKSLGPFIWQTRLVSTDEHLSQFVNLMDRLRGADITPMVQDDVVSWLPADPNFLLIAVDWRDPLHPGLVRIDVRDGKAQQVSSSDRRVSGWFADATGAPRLAYGDPDRDVPDFFLVGGKGELSGLSGAAAAERDFEPVAAGPSADELIVLSSHEGTRGLYLYSLSRGAYERVLFRHPRFDIDGVVLSPDGQRVVGARYVADNPEVAYLEDGARARGDHIASLLGGRDAELVAQSPDGRFVIATLCEAGRRTTVEWLDLERNEVRQVARYHPAYDAVAFGQRLAVSFKSRDGVDIPGYVTLPPGVADLTAARALPFVVMPHGGPAARDNGDFDWWAQFVATRGYAVFQPNFRGSAGYGHAFHDAGARAWGGTVMNDIYDGTAWLVAKGYADPHRMCIAGWSFGGYAALEAAVQPGSPFRCAVDIAGVSDLRSMISYDDGFQGGGRATWAEIGDLKREWARIAEQSPSHHAADLSMPLLIVHGAADTTVPVDQSHLMRDRLKAAHKAAQYLELDLADHSLTRERSRLAMLKAMANFLDANLGAP